MVRHHAISNNGHIILRCQFACPHEIIEPVIFFTGTYSAGCCHAATHDYIYWG